MSKPIIRGQPPVSAAELVELVLSAFPAPIVWAYRGAYARLLAEVMDCHMDLEGYVERRDSPALCHALARLSAVLMEDVRCRSKRPFAKERRIVAAVDKIMSQSGLLPRIDFLCDRQFLAVFRHSAQHWDLAQLAILFRRGWRWPT